MEEHVVINELLNFALCKLNLMPDREIVAILRQYYSEDAIDEARAILHESIPIRDSTLEARSVHHTDNLTGIIKCLKLLQEADRPLIVSKDLNNVPEVDYIKPDPDGQPYFNIKAEQKEMKCQISDMMNDIVCLKDNIGSLVDDQSSFENQENIMLVDNEDQVVVQGKRTSKKRSIELGEVDDSDDYHTESETEEDYEESICLQMEDLGSKKRKKKTNSGLAPQRVIQLDNQGGQMTMVADDNILDPMSDAARIEVDEGKQLKVENDAREFFIEVKSDFGPGIGSYNLYVCSACKYSSNDYVSVLRHMCNEVNLIGMICPICSIDCKDLPQLNRHLLEHLKISVDEKVFECVQCTSQETTYDDHIKHLSTHVWQVPFQCLSCSYKNSKILSLRKHVIRDHIESKVNGKFECQICGKLCGTRPALNKHKFMHKRKLEFPCKFCAITFHHKSARTQHENSQHINAKTYICKICGFRCDSNHALKQHEKTHDANHNLIICEVCDLRLPSRTAKRNHMNREHPNVMPYPCEFCEEKFAFPRNYYIHVKNKHKLKPIHKCNECNDSFRSYGTLKKHKTRCHPEPPTYVADTQQVSIDSFNPALINFPVFDNNLYGVIASNDVISEDQIGLSSDSEDDLEGFEIT